MAVGVSSNIKGASRSLEVALRWVTAIAIRNNIQYMGGVKDTALRSITIPFEIRNYIITLDRCISSVKWPLYSTRMGTQDWCLWINSDCWSWTLAKTLTETVEFSPQASSQRELFRPHWFTYSMVTSIETIWTSYTKAFIKEEPDFDRISDNRLRGEHGWRSDMLCVIILRGDPVKIWWESLQLFHPSKRLQSIVVPPDVDQKEVQMLTLLKVGLITGE